MPSTVEQLSPTRVKITVELPFDQLQPSMEKTYRDIAKTVNVPGFRKGKVPPMVIDQRFGRGAIIQEALNDALPRFYGQAVNENHLSPLTQPEVEVTKLEDGDLIEFTAEVDVRPEFELPDFSTLQITVDAVETSEEAVEEQLQTLRNRFGSREAVERPAAEGDIVTIDLVATRDGEALEDATAEALDYEVGSGGMLDGLDVAALGLSAGESTTFTSTLVGGPLKGEEAEISVTVTKVQKQELPEVDDEFAQLASEFDTLEELRANLRARLENMGRLDQASRARDAVLEELLSRLDLQVPENVMASEVESRKSQIESQLAAAQLDLDTYLAESGDAEDAESFWTDLERRSGDALKAQMILDKTAEERGVSVDQSDLTQHIIRRAQQENSSPQEIADHLQEHPHHIEEYMQEIRRSKALALIVEAAEVTDSDGAPVDLVHLRPDGTVGDPAEQSEAQVAENDEAVGADEPTADGSDDER